MKRFCAVCDIGFSHGGMEGESPFSAGVRRRVSVMAVLVPCLLLGLFLCSGALADTLTLPDGLETIEAEAFYGDVSVTSVVMPDTVKTIGPRAFAGTGLTYIRLSSGLTGIDDTAFSGVKNLTVDAEEGTWAAQWWANSMTRFYDYDFTFLNDGTVRLDSYTGPERGNVIIPGTVDGKPVTVIGDGCFFDRYQLTGSLVIPDTVTTIGEGAFFCCLGLSGSLVIPDSVTAIGNFAFEECSGFTGSIMIPASVTSIGEEPFAFCSGLTHIEVSDGNSSYKTMDGILFNKEGTLLLQAPTGKQTYDYAVPDGVNVIGSYAFAGCSGFLGTLSIPDSVTNIGEEAFFGCGGLTGLLAIPGSVTDIGVFAFYKCTGLSGIRVPGSVENIAASAFSNSNKLYVVYAAPESQAWQWFSDNGFGDKLVAVTDDEDISDLYFAFSDNGDGTCTLTKYVGPAKGQVLIPGQSPAGLEVTAIGDYAFFGCSGLTGSLGIPDSVTSIGKCAFSGCSGFTGGLTLPQGITDIGESAFSDCSGFTGSLVLPDGVTSIGYAAFNYCTGLTGSVMIPDSVTAIGISSFGHCDGFTEFAVSDGNGKYKAIDGILFNKEGTLLLEAPSGKMMRDYAIPSGVTEIGDSAFSGCAGLTGSLVIPTGVTAIGDSAFYGCGNLTGGLTISDSVTSIGSRAFYGCGGLTGSLVIPDNVTEIGVSAFYGCSGFTGSLAISSGITKIEKWVFEECSGFTGSLVIPDNVTEIGVQAFYGCSGFTGALVIPDSVTSVGDGSFRMCDGFTALEIPGSVTNIGAYAFDGCSGIRVITILNDTVSIGAHAFSYMDSLEEVHAFPNSSAWRWFEKNGFADKLTAIEIVSSPSVLD